MFGLLGLYIFTIILGFAVHVGVEKLYDYVFSKPGEEEEEEPEEVVKDILNPLLYFFFKTAAIILFAVLPALVNREFLNALVSSLILVVVLEVVFYISNFSILKHGDVKETILESLSVIIATEIVTAGGYCMALFMLA